MEYVMSTTSDSRKTAETPDASPILFNVNEFSPETAAHPLTNAPQHVIGVGEILFETASHPSPKASTRLWNIDELLVKISSHLSPNHTIRLRQVDRRTRRMVDEEKSLQQKAHLLPDFSDPTDIKVVQWFPRGYSHIHTIDGKTMSGFPITVRTAILMNLHCGSLLPSSYGQESHLWRNMFVTQPPIGELSFKCNDTEYLIESQSGVTLGHLYDAHKRCHTTRFLNDRTIFFIKGEPRLCNADDLVVGQSNHQSVFLCIDSSQK